MSLKQAVEAVIVAMDKDVADLRGRFEVEHSSAALVLMSYADQLRVACLAAGDAPPPAMPGSPGMQDYNAWLANAALAKKDADRAAKAAEVSRRAKLEEGLGERTVVLVDEDLSECYVNVPPQMPPGAYTQIAGKVYQLGADGRLYFHAGQTAKLRGESTAVPEPPRVLTAG